MPYYAKVEEDNLVTQVIKADEAFIESLRIDGDTGRWVQTSYNTHGGVHFNPHTGQPDGQPQLRYNFAGIGYTYDEAADAFVPPSPHKGWILDTDTYSWVAPNAFPDDGNSYIWNDDTEEWDNLGPHDNNG